MSRDLATEPESMDRRRELIEELRRQPDESPEPPRRSGIPTWVVVVVTGVVVAAAVYYATSRRAAAPATAEQAQAVAEAPARETESPAAAPASGAALDASGYIVARRQATVAAKITGRVAQVLIDEGQVVEQGQVLARLDASNARTQRLRAAAEREQAQATLSAARVALADARPIYERAETLYERGVISAQEFDTAKAQHNRAVEAVSVAEKADDVAAANLAIARQDEEDTVIRAPFGGIVAAKTAQPGEVVSPVSAGGGFTRTGICTIVDMRSLELQVDVSESFIGRVHIGEPVVVTLNAYPDWQIPAEVSGILPTADRSKGTVKVRIALKTLDRRIFPEMSARASFR